VSLLGRVAECRALDRLVSDAVAGRSGVLVLRGEAGIGKSALLGYVAEGAAGMFVARTVGVESEMELAFSGLHQLCAPMLGHLDQLPPPQRIALATVFGLSAGPAPDRFLVGLATLSLFAEVAEQRPLVCILEDAHWLDGASAQILAFVARRLLAERVAIVGAARTGIGDAVLAGLSELQLGGLGDSEALALLLEHLHGPLDAAVSRRIVAESHGNPLALLELPRSWTAAELAGGYGLPDHRPVIGRIEDSYARRLGLLPAATQLLVLAAAAEPVGDVALLQSAAVSLGIDMAASEPAEDAGLLRIRGRVEFAHPLVRSAVYRSAPAPDRRRVHRALANATNADVDPDRRAWHRACATPGPDDDIGAELERSAGRAQARGGIAAAAAFLRRAVELTEDPARRAERALAAAETSLQAGEFEEALRLVSVTAVEPLDDLQRARLDLLRGRLAYVTTGGVDAPRLLLSAARRLEAFDPGLACETYLIAWFAANPLGHVVGKDVMADICRAIETLPRQPGAPTRPQCLLEGLVRLITEGRAVATPVIQRAAAELRNMSPAEIRRWGWMAPAASSAVWDDEGHRAISERNLRVIREAGAFAELPQHLLSVGLARLFAGDLGGVAAVMSETETIAAATGRYSGYLLPVLLALQGNEPEASPLIADVIEQASAPGHEGEAAPAHWAAAILYNGLARYDEAKAAAEKATWNRFNPWFPMWALAELVEAATRGGDVELARDALERLIETTEPADADFARGIEARCRALLADGDGADWLYGEAIDRLGRRQLRPDQARAHLVYGEWLRQEGRRPDARQHLRAAHEMFVTMGMEAFAERARRELIATGDRVRRRSPETRDELTAQERQIARLARDGLSNPEIAAQLFISAKTVEWHLGKVFVKLGVSSRRQLRTALPDQLVWRT
jgi:DNA-binding CsgD family transcriptional regulator/tetratricopeptide (TPR) repeat protein